MCGSPSSRTGPWVSSRSEMSMRMLLGPGSPCSSVGTEQRGVGNVPEAARASPVCEVLLEAQNQRRRVAGCARPSGRATRAHRGGGGRRPLVKAAVTAAQERVRAGELAAAGGGRRRPGRAAGAATALRPVLNATAPATAIEASPGASSASALAAGACSAGPLTCTGTVTPGPAPASSSPRGQFCAPPSPFPGGDLLADAGCALPGQLVPVNAAPAPRSSLASAGASWSGCLARPWGDHYRPYRRGWMFCPVWKTLSGSQAVLISTRRS
jgi:hypothetical protein